MIEINESLDIFTGLDVVNKFFEVEFNGILLYSIHNGWSKQECFKGFLFEDVTLKSSQYVWAYRHSKDIHEGVVESYKT